MRTEHHFLLSELDEMPISNAFHFLSIRRKRHAGADLKLLIKIATVVESRLFGQFVLQTNQDELK